MLPRNESKRCIWEKSYWFLNNDGRTHQTTQLNNEWRIKFKKSHQKFCYSSWSISQAIISQCTKRNINNAEKVQWSIKKVAILCASHQKSKDKINLPIQYINEADATKKIEVNKEIKHAKREVFDIEKVRWIAKLSAKKWWKW